MQELYGWPGIDPASDKRPLKLLMAGSVSDATGRSIFARGPSALQALLYLAQAHC